MKTNYKEAIDTARKQYFLLPKEMYCQGLDTSVLVTRSGWEHLVNKKNRTIKQVYYRVKYLHLVPRILADMKYFQSHSFLKKGCNNHQYWSFQVVIDSACVEVVVRQTGNQPKHFYSLVYKGGTPRYI